MIAQGIAQTAQALGMDPVDLATIISYETAGTFDPSKRGPTTQWGQHRGLIQFGEPQAREYGVDWNDPVGSQLGPDGAIVNYFRRNGWRPGMGMLDAYSIVNAGAPGRYNASDANNGGAPGTVRDKVEQQMADHRRNAERLLGSTSGQGGDLLAVIDQRSRPRDRETQREPSRAEAVTDKLATMNALAQFMPQAQTQDVRNFLAQPQQPQQLVGFGPGTNPFLVG